MKFVKINAKSPLETKQGYCGARIGKPFSANPYGNAEQKQKWDDGWEAFHGQQGYRPPPVVLSKELSITEIKKRNSNRWNNQKKKRKRKRN